MSWNEWAGTFAQFELRHVDDVVQGKQAATRADLSPPCLQGFPACTLLRSGVQASLPFIYYVPEALPANGACVSSMVDPRTGCPICDSAYSLLLVDVHLCNLPFPLESLPSGVGSDPFTFLLFLPNYMCIFLTIFFV